MTEFGTVTVTDGEGKTHVYPCYGCGHCSDTIVVRPDRSRPRVSCTQCGRLICEKKELCRVTCTPIYEMSADKFEKTDKWGKMLPALMAGLTTVKEAQDEGLLKEF